ncbi:MAG: transporter substrate-binding domain-containing protein [Verrucomicrobiota bacterium]
MVQRRFIRVLVPFSRMYYDITRGQQSGISYEFAREFEKVLNQKLQTGTLKVQVVFIPVARDRLIPDLVAGRGDLVAVMLAATPDRLAQAAFSTPFATEVKEVVVTGPAAPVLRSLRDLAGREVVVRPSSSARRSLEKLNQTLATAGAEAVRIGEANENLEDEDLLELVQAGALNISVTDEYTARLWSRVYPQLIVHEAFPLSTGGSVGWAMRKNSPALKTVVDEFAQQHKKGTLFGNIMINRFLRSTNYLSNPISTEDLQRFNEGKALLQQYAQQYRLDWLLVGAQAYQESHFNQNAHSASGAVGVMQVLPATAAGHPIYLDNMERLENNLHAGTKYLRWLMDQYFRDPQMDELNRQLFALAAYNAGPGRVSTLRRKATAQGLDANKWFYNVEIVAARDIGRETVQYVSNIMKYYLAYKRYVEQDALKSKVRQSVITDKVKP